ncbi:MAG: HlyD family efflux transporter periplasmic adaptor subunit [Acetatifactor sp.]|nr:HlyD family efflux transporter periplasmic adaptor subunit [Acetatifactor sp.]
MVIAMNENGTKKREWVKNAAIVFLIILLLLTFFSNTIQNYSLPEVATQYVETGSITAKIRGMGVVESGDPYSVKIAQSEVREVTSVEVRAGDKVEAGQVICYLVEGDSKPLEEARKVLKEKQDALENAQRAFEQALLTSEYDVPVMQNAGNTASLTSYLNQIYAAENAVNVAQQDVKAAEAKVKEWDQKIQNLERQIEISQFNNVDVSKETKAVNDAQAVLNEIEKNLVSAENWLTTLKDQIAQEEDRLATVSGGDASVLDSLNAQRLAANQNVINLQSQQRTARQNLDTAQAALDAKKATGDTTATINNLNQQLANTKLEREKANDLLVQRQEILTINENNRKDLITNISATYSLSGLRDTIMNAQEEVDLAQSEVDKLSVADMSNEVKAPISGTITAINVKSGNEVPADGIIATMQPEGKGYTMSFSVTNQQAQRLSVGDQAELVNAWRYDDVQVTLSSIKPDPNNPGQNKLLTFDVTGEGVIAGQSLNVSVGQKSASYDMTVPNSAIREDSNGKFILVITSKSSPIGTRYFASRVDVEVLASDDTRSAISGGVESYSYVITTSTKPVEAGKQVRLANN